MNSNHDNELCFRPDKSLLWFGVLIICVFGVMQLFLVTENELLLAMALFLFTLAGIWFIGMWRRCLLFLKSQSVHQQGVFSCKEVRWDNVESVSWHDKNYVVLKHGCDNLTIVLSTYGKCSKPVI